MAFFPQALQKAFLAMHLLSLSQLFFPHPTLEPVVDFSGPA